MVSKENNKSRLIAPSVVVDQFLQGPVTLPQAGKILLRLWVQPVEVVRKPNRLLQIGSRLRIAIVVLHSYIEDK